ncbi:uncharacterized protein BO80DRAFT_462154, partial [Aspergillus ibericus CBS 121593]
MKRIDTRFRANTPVWSVHLTSTLTEEGLQHVLKDESTPDAYVLILDQGNYLGLFGERISKVSGEENAVLR